MLPSLIVILPPPLSGCLGALEGRREEGGGILSFSMRGGRFSPPLLLCPVVGEWLCQCLMRWKMISLERECVWVVWGDAGSVLRE